MRRWAAIGSRHPDRRTRNPDYREWTLDLHDWLLLLVLPGGPWSLGLLLLEGWIPPERRLCGRS